jgi:hypothetical protein
MAATGNDERCVEPIKALVKTVAVVNGLNTSRVQVRICRLSARWHPRRSQAPTRWHNSSRGPMCSASGGRLKSVIGVDGRPSFSAAFVFKADGTYISGADVSGRYQVVGSTVTLPNLYVRS